MASGYHTEFPERKQSGGKTPRGDSRGVSGHEAAGAALNMKITKWPDPSGSGHFPALGAKKVKVAPGKSGLKS